MGIALNKKHTPVFEILMLNGLGFAAFFTILISLAIVGVLVFESLPFFQAVSLSEYFGSLVWQPLMEPREFGIWALVSGTLIVALISSCVAFPLGLGAAVFLAEFASARVRGIVKPILEVLAGVPSVVFGYFALLTITPVVAKVIPGVEVFNAFSAGLVIGFMTLPLVTSISDDCLSAVSSGVKEGAYALGAKKNEVILRVCIPAAASGIVASFILAFSRAIGETMVVALAAGSTPHFTVNPFVGIQTMTAYIVQVSLGDTPHGTVEYHSIFVVGLTLFVITLVANVFAYRIVKRIKRRHS